MAFALLEARAFGLAPESAACISRIIPGTDLGRPWETLSFDSEKERIATEILAAADLLGQMADRAYLEKLLFLYYEFREAGIGGYDSTFDILKKTAGFYASTKNRQRTRLGMSVPEKLRRKGKWLFIINEYFHPANIIMRALDGNDLCQQQFI